MYCYYETRQQYALVFTGYLIGLRTVYYQPELRVLYTAASRARNRARNRQGLYTKGSETTI